MTERSDPVRVAGREEYKRRCGEVPICSSKFAIEEVADDTDTGFAMRMPIPDVAVTNNVGITTNSGSLRVA